MLSIVVPTLNEEKTIGDFLNILNNLRIGDFEVIIIDDSVDNTAKIASSIAKKLKIKCKITKRVGKRGKGSAIRDGMKIAKGEYIALIDADLQYNPKDLERMLPLLKDYDLINTRRLRKDSFFRKFEGFLFRVLVFLLFGLKLETQSTLRAFRKELKKISFSSNGFAWDVEFLYKAKKFGYRIKEIPIIYGIREKGKSKVRLITSVKMLIELLSVRSHVR